MCLITRAMVPGRGGTNGSYHRGLGVVVGPVGLHMRTGGLRRRRSMEENRSINADTEWKGSVMEWSTSSCDGRDDVKKSRTYSSSSSLSSLGRAWSSSSSSASCFLLRVDIAVGLMGDGMRWNGMG